MLLPLLLTFTLCFLLHLWANLNLAVLLVTGRAHHGHGPQSSPGPLELHPQRHQGGTLRRPHLTQVRDTYPCEVRTCDLSVSSVPSQCPQVVSVPTVSPAFVTSVSFPTSPHTGRTDMEDGCVLRECALLLWVLILVLSVLS